MTKLLFSVLTALFLAVGMTAQPAAAQPYDSRYNDSRYNDGNRGEPNNHYSRGFRDRYNIGYRIGFSDGKAKKRYNDRIRGNNSRNADAYRAGYRIGFADGKARHRYDARIRGNIGPFNAVDRSGSWRQRYSRNYTYNDDMYYRECRNSSDPGGIFAGALIGGLLGNSVGRGDGQTGATIAGVIIGASLGAGLTRNLDCDDQSYAYRSYYDGLNSGRSNSNYGWRNPDNDNYGEFRVGSYYNDPDGFRCTPYSQVVYIGGRQQSSRGVACQQPDGTWAIVS